ncbi:NAD(P)-binding protein [Lactifluus volemus]|nr:NAD(P)-binding protein [Lactifluus volemus]
MGIVYHIGIATFVALVIIVPCQFIPNRFSKRRSSRPKLVPPGTERVLVLGASSGIGRSIAQRYAERGAKVCVVARRSAELAGICADFTRAEDLVSIRETISEKWHGLDTLIVAAGVSALRPVLDVAGVQGPSVAQPSRDGVQRLADVAQAAIKGNYLGPLLSAVTMIPLMRGTSVSPSVLLLSSLGAVIPAPTRAIYGSSKAASFLFYQALAIENPSVDFSYVLPSTVRVTFEQLDPNQTGLKCEVVADRCIRAIDAREEIIFIPSFYRFAQLLLWLWPSYVKHKASQKYQFTPT